MAHRGRPHGQLYWPSRRALNQPLPEPPRSNRRKEPPGLSLMFLAHRGSETNMVHESTIKRASKPCQFVPLQAEPQPSSRPVFNMEYPVRKNNQPTHTAQMQPTYTMQEQPDGDNRISLQEQPVIDDRSFGPALPLNILGLPRKRARVDINHRRAYSVEEPASSFTFTFTFTRVLSNPRPLIHPISPSRSAVHPISAVVHRQQNIVSTTAPQHHGKNDTPARGYTRT